MPATTSQPKAASLVFQAALAAATLWDFRTFDVRMFDGAALALFGLWILLTPEPVQGFLERRRPYWLMFATLAVYAVAGFALHQHRSALAILVLAAAGFVAFGKEDRLTAAGRILWPLVFVHILAFAIQFVAFYGFGRVIDYMSVIGEQARIMRSPAQMRAAGLFQEPNSYCLNMLVITSLAIAWRPSRLGTLAAAASMAVSESLWGVGAAVLLILLNELRRPESMRRSLREFATIALTVCALFNGYLWLSKNENENIPYFYWRIGSIMLDPSLHERYLRNTCAAADRLAIPPPTAASIALGDGFSTAFFEQCLPANGMSFLFKSLGLVGLAALIAGFWLALRGLPARLKMYAAAAVAFSFTSYPLMTYFLFWLWLPIMIGTLRAGGAPRGSAVQDEAARPD